MFTSIGSLRATPKRRGGRARAFTLVEIILVIAILISLTGLLFPALVQARRSAQARVCSSNLHNNFLAASLYATDHDDVWPLGKDCADLFRPDTWPLHLQPAIERMPLLSDQLQVYSKSKGTWSCPLDEGLSVLDTQPIIEIDAPRSLFDACGMSYRYNTSLGLQGVPFTAFPNLTGLMYLQDQSGHWHPNTQALPRGVDPTRMDLWTQGFRYNTVFGDGHQRLITFGQSAAAWQGQL